MRKNNFDQISDGFQLRGLLDTSMTVYESEITEIEEKQSEFQGNITIYYVLLLKNLKLGPRIKRKSDFRGEDIKELENLKARISQKIYDENDLYCGDKVKFNGKLVKHNSLGYIFTNVRILEKVQQNQIGFFHIYEEKIKEEEIRKKRVEQKILNALQEFASIFPRIHLKELVDNVKMNEKKVIKIVEKLIENKIIPATYDRNSRGIEFNVMAEKIDELSTTIEGWGKGDKEKANSSFKKKINKKI